MKRLCSVLLVCLLILSVCACGKTESSAPSWQEQYDLGVKYLSEGDYDEAVVAFTAAIKIDPKRAEAYVGRGDAYMNIAKSGGTGAGTMYRRAQQDYEQAIDMGGKKAEVYEKLADAYTAAGDDEKAQDALERGYEATGDEELKTSPEPTPAPSQTPAPKALSAADLTRQMCQAVANNKYNPLLGMNYAQIVKQYGSCTGYTFSGDRNSDNAMEYFTFKNLDILLEFADPQAYNYTDDSGNLADSLTGSQADARINHSSKCCKIIIFNGSQGLGLLMPVPEAGFVPVNSISNRQPSGDSNYCFSSGGYFCQLYTEDNQSPRLTADTILAINK
jgi:hypothetical protein